jgi:subtilisin-like proprotein convertase family protein
MLRYVQFLTLLACIIAVMAVPAVAKGTLTEAQGFDQPITDHENLAPLNQGGGLREYCNTQDIDIPDNQPAGITSTISVGPNEIIQDLNVFLDIDHQRVGNLRLSLTNGQTSVVLMDRPRIGGNCDGNNLDDVLADDEAGSESLQQSCDDTGEAYEDGGSYLAGSTPSDIVLSAYDGGSTNRNWQLNIQDLSSGTNGTLRRWCVRFTVPTPTPVPPTATRTPSPLPPSATPTTVFATPTEPPLPTNTPTATATNTPQVPPTPTATPTATNTPLPGTRYTYLAPTLRGAVAGNCQSVEDETLFPNNSINDARSTRPLCHGRPFQGIHNTPDSPEDIFRFIVAEGGTTTYNFTLEVPDINLSLRLYGENVNELAASTNPDGENEGFQLELTPGTYFVRVYRADEQISQQPYTLTILP